MYVSLADYMRKEKHCRVKYSGQSEGKQKKMQRVKSKVSIFTVCVFK